MQLKRRILLILLLAMALLVGALTLTGWLGEQRWQQRYNDALLQNQRIAWDKLQSEQLENLEAVARRLLESPDFQNVRDAQATTRIEALLARTVREASPGMRIDVLSPRGSLLATT